MSSLKGHQWCTWVSCVTSSPGHKSDPQGAAKRTPETHILAREAPRLLRALPDSLGPGAPVNLFPRTQQPALLARSKGPASPGSSWTWVDRWRSRDTALPRQPWPDWMAEDPQDAGRGSQNFSPPRGLYRSRESDGQATGLAPLGSEQRVVVIGTLGPEPRHSQALVPSPQL